MNILYFYSVILLLHLFKSSIMLYQENKFVDITSVKIILCEMSIIMYIVINIQSIKTIIHKKYLGHS